MVELQLVCGVSDVPLAMDELEGEETK